MSSAVLVGNLVLVWQRRLGWEGSGSWVVSQASGFLYIAEIPAESCGPAALAWCGGSYTDAGTCVRASGPDPWVMSYDTLKTRGWTWNPSWAPLASLPLILQKEHEVECQSSMELGRTWGNSGSLLSWCLPDALAVCTKAEREQVLVLGALQLVHLKWSGLWRLGGCCILSGQHLAPQAAQMAIVRARLQSLGLRYGGGVWQVRRGSWASTRAEEIVFESKTDQEGSASIQRSSYGHFNPGWFSHHHLVCSFRKILFNVSLLLKYDFYFIFLEISFSSFHKDSVPHWGFGAGCGAAQAATQRAWEEHNVDDTS